MEAGLVNPRKDGARFWSTWLPSKKKKHNSRVFMFTFYMINTNQYVILKLMIFIYLFCFQFSSVQSLSRARLCDPMNFSTPGLPVHHQLPEFTQTHVHRVSDAIQPSHPLSSPSPPAPNPSQHQSLFQWVNSSHEVAKVLEFQLQHHFAFNSYTTGFLSSTSVVPHLFGTRDWSGGRQLFHRSGVEWVGFGMLQAPYIYSALYFSFLIN